MLRGMRRIRILGSTWWIMWRGRMGGDYTVEIRPAELHC
jgi:hypothetical protein